MEIMKKLLLLAACGISLLANDIIIKESHYGVSKTIENIKKIVTKKGLSVFTIVNHQANAAGVGMEMGETKLIIFGNPKIGTKLMEENILVGLDLPMKVLVYRDADNKVKLAYRDGTWLKNMHALKNNKLTSTVDHALDNITNKAIK